jgi:hypothetical protein
MTLAWKAKVISLTLLLEPMSSWEADASAARMWSSNRTLRM